MTCKHHWTVAAMEPYPMTQPAGEPTVERYRVTGRCIKCGVPGENILSKDELPIDAELFQRMQGVKLENVYKEGK